MGVLVAGGAGFLGRHLALRLARQGESVTVADNFSRARRQDAEDEFSPHGIRLVSADLTTSAGWEAAGRGYEVCYHLAAVNGTQRFYDAPGEVLRVNLLTVLEGAEALRFGRFQRLVWASSSEVYAGTVEAGGAPVPTDEEVVLTVGDIRNPRFSYAASKIAGEAVLQALAREGLDARIVRPHNVFGPGQPPEHVIPAIIGRLLARTDPLVVTGPEQTRAFCYVEDAVAAIRAVGATPDLDGGIFNIGDDRYETRIDELTGRLVALAGYAPRVEFQPAPAGSVARRCPDLRAVREATGWDPQWDFGDALAATFAWAKANAATVAADA